MSFLNLLAATPIKPLPVEKFEIQDYWIRYYKRKGGYYTVCFKGRLIGKCRTMEDAWKIQDQHAKERASEI